MPIMTTLALMALAAKRAYDQNHRHTPECVSCARPVEWTTKCCGKPMCEGHFQAWVGNFPGRCPLCGTYHS